MDYKYYGLGPTTPEYSNAVYILQYIKHNNKNAMVVLGGPHASKECFKDGFDLVVSGHVADENLVIDRSLIDIKSYKYFINDRLATTLVTAIGCPYKCAFCSKNNPVVKFKKVDKIIEEIEYLHFEFGYDALMFFDDTFILNIDRITKICRCLKRLGIIWRCFVRADLVVKHGDVLLEMMSDSGCVEVGMGIESGSDTILNNIHKGESVQDIESAIKMIHDNGIRVKGFFIVGLPGESQQTLDETRSFLDNTYLDGMDFTLFKPYPGSPIYNNRKDYDIEWNDLKYSDMFYKGKPGEYINLVNTSSLSPEDILIARDSLERKYGFIGHNSCQE